MLDPVRCPHGGSVSVDVRRARALAASGQPAAGGEFDMGHVDPRGSEVG
jgi:hypothetical protein